MMKVADYVLTAVLVFSLSFCVYYVANSPEQVFWELRQGMRDMWSDLAEIFGWEKEGGGDGRLGGPAGRIASGTGLRVFEPQELKRYDGSDPSLPLYLVVLGEVYDVSVGDKFYKKGEGYNIFLGQDASANFHTGNWETPVEDVRDLPLQAVEGVLGWRKFYQKAYDKYPFIGVLHGLYYDQEGNPTAPLKEVEALQQQATDANEYEEGIRKKYVGCNMKTVVAEKQTAIDCPPNDERQQRFPRIATWFHRGTKSETKRCACFTQTQLDASGELPATMKLEAYPSCPPTSSDCVVPF